MANSVSCLRNRLNLWNVSLGVRAPFTRPTVCVFELAEPAHSVPEAGRQRQTQATHPHGHTLCSALWDSPPPPPSLPSPLSRKRIHLMMMMMMLLSSHTRSEQRTIYNRLRLAGWCRTIGTCAAAKLSFVPPVREATHTHAQQTSAQICWHYAAGVSRVSSGHRTIG